MKKNIWEQARDLCETGDLARATVQLANQAGHIDPNGGMDDEFIRIAQELDAAVQKLNKAREGSKRMGDRAQPAVDAKRVTTAWRQVIATLITR